MNNNTLRNVFATARGLLNGEGTARPSYLVGAALKPDVLGRRKVAEILEVQPGQVNKYANEGTQLKPWQVRALANAVLELEGQ